MKISLFNGRCPHCLMPLIKTNRCYSIDDMIWHLSGWGFKIRWVWHKFCKSLRNEEK